MILQGWLVRTDSSRVPDLTDFADGQRYPAPMADLSFLALDPERAGLPETLCSDIRLVDRILGQVLVDQEGEWIRIAARTLLAQKADGDVFEALPELNDPSKLDRLARAFTVLFQVLNVLEQKEIVSANRRSTATGGSRRESIREALHQLRDSGVDDLGIQEILGRLEIIPTFTAHPTEAKRRAVLEKVYQVAEILSVGRGLSEPLDLQRTLEARLSSILTALWQTDEMRSKTLSVQEEVRNVLFFFERTVMEVVPWLMEDLDAGIDEFFAGSTENSHATLKYRSWVGGDRDGNPNVTPDVTWWTLAEHRRTASAALLARIREARRELSLSTKLIQTTEEFAQCLQELESAYPLSAYQQSRYSQEPYVRACLCLETALEASDPVSPSASKVHSLVEETIGFLSSSLSANGSDRLTRAGSFARLRRHLSAFQDTLAKLDIRQHSREHEKAFDEIFRFANAESNYADLPEAAKVKLLRTELRNPRPLISSDFHGTDSTVAVLGVFEVVRRVKNSVGLSGIGAYIISMAHGASDILEVLLLAKQFGLAQLGSDGVLKCDLQITPLFETIDDLSGCLEILDELGKMPEYMALLPADGDLRKQEIMLGYSDSSKDGGYFAANWALQKAIATLGGQRNSLELSYFHGRGGTVGRGGGRANRAILAQPAKAYRGRIRFTEQGEVISFRYGFPAIAHRHLEQIVSACLLAANGVGEQEDAKRSELFDRMAERSQEAYRKLVYENDRFWDFYTEATPIDFIQYLTIASRPVFRPGSGSEGVAGLRAIPWNFAWVQSRMGLPGWFGLGAALEEEIQVGPDGLARLRDAYTNSRFFRTVIDNAQLELKRAHLPTARMYAGLAEDGHGIFSEIESEFARTQTAILQIIGSESLLPSAKTVSRTVDFRNPLILPLNRLQVALMRRWSSLSTEEQSGTWRDAMLQTIAGIAAGMQSTG